MKRPDEEWEDLFGGEDTGGVWIWIIAIMAALGLVGIITVCALKMPLGEYATKQMSEP